MYVCIFSIFFLPFQVTVMCKLFILHLHTQLQSPSSMKMALRDIMIRPILEREQLDKATGYMESGSAYFEEKEPHLWGMIEGLQRHGEEEIKRKIWSLATNLLADIMKLDRYVLTSYTFRSVTGVVDMMGGEEKVGLECLRIAAHYVHYTLKERTPGINKLEATGCDDWDNHLSDYIRGGGGDALDAMHYAQLAVQVPLNLTDDRIPVVTAGVHCETDEDDMICSPQLILAVQYLWRHVNPIVRDLCSPCTLLKYILDGNASRGRPATVIEMGTAGVDSGFNFMSLDDVMAEYDTPTIHKTFSGSEDIDYLVGASQEGWGRRHHSVLLGL